MVKLAPLIENEQRILEVAAEVFRAKGKDGAKMQEIADRAGINKALLHYYFRSKDLLFERVFIQSTQEFFGKLTAIINADKPLFDIITELCHAYIDMSYNNPHFPVFMLGEMNRNPDDFIKKMFSHNSSKPEYSKFKKLVEKQIKLGYIRKVNPEQIIINILGLCIFPAISKPMLKSTLGLSEKEFKSIIDERRKSIPAWIIESLRKNRI